MSAKSLNRANIEEVHYLYYKENMTQRQIAERLGFSSHASINKLFKEQGWKARPAAPPREEANSSEVYHLYFILGKSMKEISEELELRGISPIQRIFKEKGWKSRGSSVKKRQFKNDEARALAKKERDTAHFQEIKKLREEIFGTMCEICRCKKNDRTLAIHRKDFTEHKQNHLWTKGNLQSIAPEEWVALCIACHRGVHWLKDSLGFQWNVVKSYLNEEREQVTEIKESTGNLENSILENIENTNVETLRRRLFGEQCYFCGSYYNGRRLTIHRKDGKQHRSVLLWSQRNLKSLDSNEWVSLCQKCHRYVHWAMDNLQMKWEDFERKSNPIQT